MNRWIKTFKLFIYFEKLPPLFIVRYRGTDRVHVHLNFGIPRPSLQKHFKNTFFFAVNIIVIHKCLRRCFIFILGNFNFDVVWNFRIFVRFDNEYLHLSLKGRTEEGKNLIVSWLYTFETICNPTQYV